MSGTNATEFSVTAQPASPVAAVNNTTFQVSFNPAAASLRTATISIANNDANENPYDFNIQGTALPDVTISGTVTDGTGPIEGAVITFSHDSHTEATAADGTYFYTVPSGTSTTITPSHPGYSSWDPEYRQLTNILDNQPAQDFLSTSDADAIPTQEESGPEGTDPSYDGNGDGIPDCNQPNVVSFHTADGNNYVTFAAPDGTIFQDVQALPAPAPGIFSSRISFPYGIFRFALNGVPPGGAVQVTLFLSGSVPVDSYWKYGKEPGNETEHPYDFAYSGEGTGAEIIGNTIILHFIDGQRGDDDLTPDGIIVDDGAPVATSTVIPALSNEGMIALVILLSFFAFLMIRRRKI